MQENINIPDSTITTNLSFRQLVLMNMQQLTNFPYIEKDFDALTDYELLCLVVKFLNDVIANQNEQNDSITRMYESFLALQDYVNDTKNTLEDAFNELDDYVRNYFDNLDVQEEINNKLNKMLEDGVLEQIIEQFIQSSAIWCFDSVADMKLATNLVNGSSAQTLGYYNTNDGGKSLYQIRTKTNDDIIDEMFLISLYDNTLVAELIIDNQLNINQLGAKENDSTFDNSSIIEKAVSTCDNIILNGETYYIDNIIELTSLNNKNINGNNSVIKGKGFSDTSVGNTGLLNITTCSNISIDNLFIDGDIEWISRPYSWENGYSNYNTLRNKTYDGFRIVSSSDININKCKATKIKVGYHFSGCSNCSVDNSESTYTMADGVLIHGGCSAIRVSNHYVEYGNDDQFSMVHESDDTNYVRNCSYINCNAINSFGACCVMQECIDCYALNCSSKNNKDVPFKMGTSLGTFACSNCTMDNIKVESENIIQGTSANLSTAQSNGTMATASTTGAVSLNNCKLINCVFKETSGNNLSWYNPNHSGLKFENCLFDGINIIFIGVNDILFDNCIINSHDGNTETRCSITFRNCSITDDVTYTARGNRALSCNNCHDIILDNVKLSGKTQTAAQLLSFYCDDNTYSTAYVDVNETNISITNMVDIYKNGVLKLADINNYGYGRFREGQLLYFESNDSLYLVHGTGWTKLNQ